MTAIEQFIKDAKEGGCGSHVGKDWRVCAGYIEHLQPSWGKQIWERVHSVHKALLDKDAWQAVGKTRGWSNTGWDKYTTQAIFNWHRFIDHLADGKSVEQSLSALKE